MSFVKIIRRPAAEFESGLILDDDQIGFETDTKKFKIGDNVTTWANLLYADPTAVIAALALKADSLTAADATARLALTGLTRGARVYQTDNGFWYELTNAAAPSDAASWYRDQTVQVISTTVNTNVGTKQALLAAVPTGKVRIVTSVVARNASADLSTMADIASVGFTAGADGTLNLSDALLAGLTSAVKWFSLATDNIDQTVGAAGEVFGIMFADVSINATVTIDTHFYDVPA